MLSLASRAAWSICCVSARRSRMFSSVTGTAASLSAQANRQCGASACSGSYVMCSCSRKDWAATHTAESSWLCLAPPWTKLGDLIVVVSCAGTRILSPAPSRKSLSGSRCCRAWSSCGVRRRPKASRGGRRCR
eukprot:6466540-Amphidinium_carterae.1